ncbi:MAG TPA: PAS domain S-box protein, partial [Ktedonobacteraceae bacterium]|nr:PAS domain S-box protein [Ktedonobacteraceae bacterium]
MALQDEQIVRLFGTQNTPLSVQEQVQLQATILDTITESIIVTDLTGTITYWNKGAHVLFGYTREEAIGKTPALLYPDRDEHQLAHDLQQVLDGQDYVGEWMGRRKDATTVWVAIKTTLLRNSAGEVVGFLGVAADITARKEAEEIRRRLAAIVESSDDAIVGKTLNGIITSWNTAAERLFGYSAGEAIGKHITLIIPAELYQEEEEIIGKLRQGIRIQHYETVRLRKDGTRIEVSLSISPVRDDGGKIIGAAKIARDISERREQERRKDEFIGMASHELKTPVTSLKGFTQLLQRRFLKHNDKEAVRFLARMDAQIDRLTTLIGDMLDLSKMQSSQLAYRMERFHLAELVEEIVENVQETTQTHHLLLEKTVEVQIYGDRDRIGQVLINLLTNAIKYSPAAERIIVRMAIQEETVVVSVQDFGIGISESYHESIFQRFYQVNEPAEKTYPGLGIGLYIARQIIEKHQGRLWVGSR